MNYYTTNRIPEYRPEDHAEKCGDMEWHEFNSRTDTRQAIVILLNGEVAGLVVRNGHGDYDPASGWELVGIVPAVEDAEESFYLDPRYTYDGVPTHRLEEALVALGTAISETYY